MRIELDSGLAKTLNAIKKKEPSVYGRGHVQTVRFLATYYERHKPLEKLLEDLELNLTHFLENLDPNIEASLERVFRKALANVIANSLTTGTKEYENQTRSAGDPGARSSAIRRKPDAISPGPAVDVLQEETFK